jgi:hypothetical protein
MLGDAIAAALPEMRAEAESLMVDSCTITRGGSATTIDEDTGVVGSGSATTVYFGKCRLQTRNVQPNTTAAGETEYSLLAYVLQVPMSVVGVAIGDVVTVTGTLDDDLDARRFTVTGVVHKTHLTARRLALEEVT